MSTQPKDGGPAFPAKLPLQDTRTQEAADFAFFAGMSLRDYFAAHALIGIFCNFTPATARRVLAEGGHCENEIAKCAYEIADAMLEASEQVKP